MITIMENESFPIDIDFYSGKLEEAARRLELEGDVTVKLGDREESRELNKTYRQKDSATDVLSFPFNDELPEEGYYVGDIFVCCPVARDQAEENGITYEEELLRLMLHGLVHLAGHDHETDDGEMAALEEELIQALI